MSSSTKFSRSRLSGFFLFSLIFLVASAQILFLFPQNVGAVDVTLAWDANTEADLAGYRVFYREEGQFYNYTQPDWEGGVSDTTCAIPNLDDNKTYFFVARAFDTSYNESANSNEVCYQPNLAPIADAGPDQTVDEAVTVTLDGSNSSDPDGSITSYLWTQTTGTSVMLSDATSPTPTFTAPNVGTDGEALTFQLTVTDDGGLQATDSCIVNVSSVNLAPIADAGPDQTVDEAVTVTLDSSNSSDPDGSIASYLWTQTTGTSVMLSDATSPTPTFTAPNVGTDGEALTFQLTVTDDGGLQAADSCIVNVSWVDEPPTLSSVSIDGASSVNENATSNYTATATFSDGSTQTVTESVTWTEDSSFATINSLGVLSTAEVMSDQTVIISAGYTYGDVTETAQKLVTIVDIPQSNLPPTKPQITSPYYGQIGCELLTLVTTEPFSDPDGDSHGQSRWDVSKQQDFSSIIHHATSTKHLTELTVPHAVLEPDTTYFIRVQFSDAYLEPSEWSDTIEFTTISDTNDLDGDGIPDDQEVGDDVDLNGDGIPDNYQPDVIKCVRSEIDNTIIGVCAASDSIAAIEVVRMIDPSTISDKMKRPEKFLLGLFSYRISLHEPGATAMVRIYFSESISKAKKFYKYDTISGWEDYTKHTTFNDDGRSVTLEVKDGGYGDSDGVANGVIVDPGGLAEAAEAADVDETSHGTSSAAGGGCFIATAAFGSYAEPHVQLLRDFRDQCLLTNTPGRWFVRMYYRYGPFWADLINIHTWCKPAVRLALMPLVGTSYVLIKASVATRILTVLLPALLLVAGCFLLIRGRPVTGSKQL